jgi:hypothetical protein
MDNFFQSPDILEMKVTKDGKFRQNKRLLWM